MARWVVWLVTALVACSGGARPNAVVRPDHARGWLTSGGGREEACALGWGCPRLTDATAASGPVEHTTTVAPPAAPSPPPALPCAFDRDCTGGDICTPVAGCASGGVCRARDRCGPAFVAHCDCDGATFYAPEGCAGRAHASEGPCTEIGEAVTERFSPEEASDRTRPAHRATACTSDATCGRGRRCWGIEGCTTTWTCERVRGCPRQTDQWCGCDGETFVASRSCPGRPVRHRGACE